MIAAPLLKMTHSRPYRLLGNGIVELSGALLGSGCGPTLPTRAVGARSVYLREESRKIPRGRLTAPGQAPTRRVQQTVATAPSA